MKCPRWDLTRSDGEDASGEGIAHRKRRRVCDQYNFQERREMSYTLAVDEGDGHVHGDGVFRWRESNLEVRSSVKSELTQSSHASISRDIENISKNEDDR